MSELKQLSGCKECDLSRKRIIRGRDTIIYPELCQWGGLIAVEEGNKTPFACSRKV